MLQVVYLLNELVNLVVGRTRPTPFGGPAPQELRQFVGEPPSPDSPHDQAQRRQGPAEPRS